MSDNDFRHIMGSWQWWGWRLLGRVPRALCGELLLEREDVPPPNTPWCPACLERNGSHQVTCIP